MRKRLYVVTGLLAVDLVVTAGHTHAQFSGAHTKGDFRSVTSSPWSSIVSRSSPAVELMSGIQHRNKTTCVDLCLAGAHLT